MVLAAIGVALLKLWLVRDEEILAGPSAFDQVRYARMADSLMQGRWLGSYDALTLIRHPGYPLWIWLSGLLGGIPFRIAAELVLCASGLALAVSVARSGFPPWLGLLAHAAVVMQPDSLAINRQLFAENLYAPLLVLATASALRLLRADAVRERLLQASALGLCLAILWQTRPERILVVLFLLSLGTVDAAARFGRGRRDWLPGLSTALLPPLVLVAASSLAVSRMNRAFYGVATSCELFSPGFSAAQDALLSIRSGPSRRYVAIPAASRLLAYEASPAFRELRGAIEEELKPRWTVSACRELGICDDYINGKFLFVMREAAARAGYHRSAPAAEAFYSRIAAELRAACEAGAIPCRRPLMRYVRSDLLPDLPAAALEALSLFAPRERPPAREADGIEVRRLFDRVARRRVPPQGAFLVAGWAFGDREPVARVLLVEGRGRILAQTTNLVARPDVRRHFATTGEQVVPERTGFSLSGAMSPDASLLPEARLLFLLASGRAVEAPLRPLAPDLPVRYGVDVLEESTPASAGLAPGTGWVLAYRSLVVALSLTALFSGVVFLALGRPSRILGTLWAAPALVGAVVAARAAFVVLAHAFLFPVDVRYAYPVLGLYLALAAMLTWMAGRMLVEPRGADGSPPTAAQ
jgi:hypothetical protein